MSSTDAPLEYPRRPVADVQLSWFNKEKVLRARGADDYDWLDADDPWLDKPPSIEVLTGDLPNVRSNVLAVGDGLDVIEALAAHTISLVDGIRLVYIDPPFNTQVNFRQYNDTMQRSQWLS